MAISIVVFTILVIQWVALSFLSLAVKAVIETPRAVTLPIALAVVEVAPTLKCRRAVLPGVIKVERAVSSVPAARMVVAQRVAYVVSGPFVTLWVLAANLHLRGRGDVPAEPSVKGVVEDVAQEPVEIAGAAALEERSFGRDLAGSTVVTGVGDAKAVSGGQALRSSERGRAQAAWTKVTGHTCSSILAAQTAAGA